MVVGASALVLGQPRLHRGGARLGRTGPRHCLQSQPRFHAEQKHSRITPEQIDRDMAQLSLLTGRVRTYTVAGGMDKVPEIARRYGLTVSLGSGFRPDLDQNETEYRLCDQDRACQSPRHRPRHCRQRGDPVRLRHAPIS